jgi:hypothetical protein
VGELELAYFDQFDRKYLDLGFGACILPFQLSATTD